MKQHTFLVEIGTEELPPKALRTLAEAFSTNISVALDAARINHGQVSWFATPRRLAVKIVSLSDTQTDQYVEKRGPAIMQAFDVNGNPTKEAEGWARSCGITVLQAKRLATEKGEWLVYQSKRQGMPVQELLCGIVSNALDKLPIAKRMRWGNKEIKFIRPVHTVTLMLDNKVIKGSVLGITSSRIIRGHRFMGQREISLDHADQYPQILLELGYVMANYDQRKEVIRRDAETAARRIGGVADVSDSLLEEVTSLVEWPVVLTAGFERQFLVVPQEALVYIITSEQKCFPIYDHVGNLLPKFIFVANLESKDPQQIIIGNEKVMRPRLADAEFFFNIDRKHRLEDRLSHLNTVLFQKQLGTLRDKSDRMKYLAAWIASQIGANTQQAARAGWLSKCDLITNMVCEFTNTQGIMGMHYARHDGEPEAIALAQKEQYQPRFLGDALPTTPISYAVAIADKIDTLVGIFGIGQYPKGDKDPFALRRAALGVLHIIVEKQLPLDLQTLTEEAVRLYGKRLTNSSVVCDVITFILGRFRAWYQELGHSVDTIQAILVQRPTRPVDFNARVHAVSYFRTLESAAWLTTINKRIVNILAQSYDPVYPELQESLLKDQMEINLATHLAVLRKELQPLFAAGHYKKALVKLASLYKPVDAFFANVKVMVDDRDVRVNRLTLLDQLRRLFLQVADMSLLK